MVVVENEVLNSLCKVNLAGSYEGAARRALTSRFTDGNGDGGQPDDRAQAHPEQAPSLSHASNQDEA